MTWTKQESLQERAREMKESAEANLRWRKKWEEKQAEKYRKDFEERVKELQEQDAHAMDKWQPAMQKAKEHLEQEAAKEQALIDSLLNNNGKNKR